MEEVVAGETMAALVRIALITVLGGVSGLQGVTALTQFAVVAGATSRAWFTAYTNHLSIVTTFVHMSKEIIDTQPQDPRPLHHLHHRHHHHQPHPPHYPISVLDHAILHCQKK